MHLDRIQSGLRAVLGDKVIVDDAERANRSHDFWLLDMQRRLHGSHQPLPACVVAAENDADVATVLRFAHENGVSVVPYGAGSGVCGGARASEGYITLDLRKMNRLVEINEVALTATVEPGMLGSDFERALNDAGYSMGHFPQSMRLSSVGGWVATRASGQFSTKYGSIENMLVCLEGYLPNGVPFCTRNTPRSATGPSIDSLMLGSEGILGVITKVTYKIHPLPEAQEFGAFAFANFDEGLEAIRLIMRDGWKPALVRLYDASETRRHFQAYARRGSCVLLLLSEGPRKLAEVEFAECSKRCLEFGARQLGKPPVRHWLEKRFVIPDLHELATRKGVVFDTIEVAANWDRVGDLYHDAIAALTAVPGIANASAHSSHSYQQGTCLYFTFAVKKPKWVRRQLAQLLGAKEVFSDPADLPEIESSYEECWRAVMNATINNGGTISHHHGIGRLRMPWLAGELSAGGYHLLRAIKRAVDPHGILNPDTLIPADRSK